MHSIVARLLRGLFTKWTIPVSNSKNADKLVPQENFIPESDASMSCCRDKFDYSLYFKYDKPIKQDFWIAHNELILI